MTFEFYIFFNSCFAMNYFALVTFSKNLKHENIVVYLHDFYFSYLEEGICMELAQTLGLEGWDYTKMGNILALVSTSHPNSYPIL